MARYPNLPGIDVNLSDGGLILPDDASTESLLVIAPSLVVNAPTEPTLVTQSSDLVANGFGDFIIEGQVNPIAAAWKQAFDGGCRRIYLLAFNLTTKDINNDPVAFVENPTLSQKFGFLEDLFYGILADFDVDHVCLVGVYTEDIAENVTADDLVSDEAKAEYPNIPGLQGKGHILVSQNTIYPVTVSVSENSFTLNGTAITLANGTYSTTSALVTAIQAGLGEAQVGVKEDKGKIVFQSKTEITLAKDADDDLLTSLGFSDGATSALDSVDAAYVSQTNGSFPLLLAGFCDVQTLNHNSVIGYIANKPPLSNKLSDVKARVSELLVQNNDFNGSVQSIAGPELGYQIPGSTAYYYTNGLVSYAALISTLSAESAPTNKPLSGVGAVQYTLSLRQLNDLTGKKYVTFRFRNNQVIVTDGITTAPDLQMTGGAVRHSDYTRLSTLRITQRVISVVREATAPFIGESNQMPQYNSLNSAVKASLQTLQSMGVINDYRFSIVVNGASLNSAIITLQIIPAFELKNITLNISLSAQFANVDANTTQQ